MNIPQSVIEPFEPLGIPMLQVNAESHSDRICEAVYNYALLTSKSRLDIPTHTACQQAEHLATEGGATWAKCSISKAYLNGDRIFTLRFNVKGCPRVANFGFAIGKIVNEPVWP